MACCPGERMEARIMSMYSPEQRAEIMENARRDLAGHVPRAQREAAASRMSGSGLIHKTRDNARIDADDGASVERALPARRAAAKPGSEKAWWQWVDDRLDDRFAEYSEHLVKVLGEVVAKTREPLQREIQLLRRELDVVRMEVNVKALQEEVRTARAEIPKLRAIAAQFEARQEELEAEQARLERELDATKDKLGKVRVTQSLTDYNLRELQKQAKASGEASIEMEFETQSSRFAVKAAHPDAARALKEFATGVINGQADGTLWLPGRAGNA
jgi:hypothetical protein